MNNPCIFGVNFGLVMWCKLWTPELWMIGTVSQTISLMQKASIFSQTDWISIERTNFMYYPRMWDRINLLCFDQDLQAKPYYPIITELNCILYTLNYKIPHKSMAPLYIGMSPAQQRARQFWFSGHRYRLCMLIMCTREIHVSGPSCEMHGHCRLLADISLTVPVRYNLAHALTTALLFCCDISPRRYTVLD